MTVYAILSHGCKIIMKWGDLSCLSHQLIVLFYPPQSALTWSVAPRRRAWRWRDQSVCQPRYWSDKHYLHINLQLSNTLSLLCLYFPSSHADIHCFLCFVPDSAYHHQEDPLWWGIQNLGSLPDEDPQAPDRSAQPIWNRQADHLHQHRAWCRGRGHHRRRINTADDWIKKQKKKLMSDWVSFDMCET